MVNQSGYVYVTNVDIYKGSVPRLVMEYLETAASNLVSPHTIEQHYYCLKDFFQFVSWSAGRCGKDVYSRVQLARKGAEDFVFADVPEEMILGCTHHDLVSYKTYIHTIVNPEANEYDRVAIYKINTARTKVYGIKSFYRWLFESDHLEKDPMQRVSADKKIDDRDGESAVSLQMGEIQRLLGSLSEKFFERDLCILLFFLTTGMRLAELVALDVDNINLEEKMVTIERGKGGAKRRVPMSDICIDQYNRYIAARTELLQKGRIVERETDVRPLFLTERYGRISRRRVQNIVEQALQRAGLDHKNYSTHKLRHTAATLMYNNGVDLNNIRALLGHRSIQTTTIYAHTDIENKRAAIEHSPVAKLDISKFTPVAPSDSPQ